MITYNPKNWLRLILSFHRSDTFRILLPAMLGLSVYVLLVVYVEHEIWKDQYVATIVVHSLLGFVISLLLVFRTNTAYDRWWEGRKAWGTMVNHSRSFSMKINAYIGKEHVQERERIRLLTGDYFVVCKDHLRGKVVTETLESSKWLDNSEFLDKAHVPNAIMTLLVREVEQVRKKGLITDLQAHSLNEEMRSFTECIGACERIKATPIPYAYNMFIKKIIFIYCLTLPFGLIKDFHYWTVLLTVFVFYSFASLELIAEEIEDPFGHDANDLPTDEIADNIRKHVNAIYRQ
jgi:ion channel-forming bestrophin family protein